MVRTTDSRERVLERLDKEYLSWLVENKKAFISEWRERLAGEPNAWDHRKASFWWGDMPDDWDAMEKPEMGPVLEDARKFVEGWIRIPAVPGISKCRRFEVTVHSPEDRETIQFAVYADVDLKELVEVMKRQFWTWYDARYSPSYQMLEKYWPYAQTYVEVGLHEGVDPEVLRAFRNRLFRQYIDVYKGVKGVKYLEAGERARERRRFNRALDYALAQIDKRFPPWMIARKLE